MLDAQQNEAIEGEGDDDGLEDVIAKVLDQSDDAEQGGDGQDDQPFDYTSLPDDDIIDGKKANDLAEEARIAPMPSKKKGEAESSNKASDGEAKEEGPPATEDSKEDKGGDGKAAPPEAGGGESESDGDGDGGGKSTNADLKSADLSSLLDGIADDKRGEIVRRIGDAERLLAPFKGREGDLERAGQTPEGAVKRLLELNDFAIKNPDQYIAWVVKNTGQSPQELFQKAATLLGLGSPKPEDGDGEDMFADPEVQALRDEIAGLKAQLSDQSPTFGPDTPELVARRAAQDQIDFFIAERDESGNPKRPFFNHLQPQIAEMAKRHQSTTGRAVTLDDLQGFYDTALETAKSAFSTPAQQTPASTNAGADVAAQIEAKTEAARRAQRASKSVAGTGESASASQGLPSDAPLDTVLEHFLNKQGA